MEFFTTHSNEPESFLLHVDTKPLVIQDREGNPLFEIEPQGRWTPENLIGQRQNIDGRIQTIYDVSGENGPRRANAYLGDQWIGTTTY